MKLSKKAIYLIIAFMVVGFSVTATVLFVNGGARIASLEEDFDIYFSSAVLDGVDKSNIFITSDKKHITFETNKLKHVNDTSVLEFEVTNNSTQYDAHVEVSCVSDVSEYVTLETDKDTFDIIAQTRESGKLTIKLYKSADSFIDGTITCTLDTSAKERETKLEKILVDPTYQITGTLQDEEGTPLEEKNLVVFSDEPHYVTTDNFGFFYVSGLEKGEHEIYYVGEADVTDKTKSEIKSMAIDEAQITTNDTSIKFDELKLDEFVVEPVKSGKVDINFDADGGEVSETKKNVELYTRASDLPIPTKVGNVFKGWHYNGKPVNENTIINDEKNLRALWDKDKYTITIDGSGFIANKTSIVIEYEQNASVKITPDDGKYIESVICDGGYTTTATVGSGAYEVQTFTIKSNSNPNSSVCTIVMHSRSYAASYLAATPKYHVHTSNCYHNCTGMGIALESGWFAYNDGTDVYGAHSKCNTCGYEYIDYGRAKQYVGQPYPCPNKILNCNKSTSVPESYSCSSGTLVGDKCYSCPNGGTLSGTTCNY